MMSLHLFWIYLLWLWIPKSVATVVHGVHANTGGATLSIEWSYLNVDSLLANGGICDRFGDSKCDVYFTLCLRNAASNSKYHSQENCLLLQYTTKTYYNIQNVNVTGANAVSVTIPPPVPNFYTFRMQIFDKDYLPDHELIGDFLASGFHLLPSETFQEVKMKNVVSAAKNLNLKLQVRMRLMCNRFHYGSQCMIKCQSDSLRYTCDAHGNKICHVGFAGPDCDTEDACYYEPCASHAQCINFPNGTGRTCKCNGREGPECYPGYDPCSTFPCEHGGLCYPTGQYEQSFRCVCPEAWTGHRCTERRQACIEAAKKLHNVTFPTEESEQVAILAELCLNGGKCLDYSDRFDYRCVCAEGWTGDRCQSKEKMHPDILILTVVMLIVCVLLMLFGGLTIGLIWRYRKSKRLMKKISREGGIVYFHSNRDSTSTTCSTLPLPHAYYKDLCGVTDNAGKTVAHYQPNSMPTSRRNYNDVYDECDPMGLYTKTDTYGTVFGDTTAVPANSSNSTNDESAPPLPERPNNLELTSTRQSSFVLQRTDDYSACYNKQNSARNSMGSTGHQRRPTVFRPFSPLQYTTPDDRIDPVCGLLNTPS
ncbi:unnamed protein product [Dicrocoelium dendriticum]|nr:unnamed protein product [Dicrocoelium dendriticum]CAH8526211.1 unnamed protein product [Dicrocoelium dendriticum]